jgi:Pyruvate/2-oxoacid:ferredoxin oxidoreductase delta subunit
MGHHIGSKSSIVPLIDRLNKYPIGLPDSEKLRAILAMLFDEEEAFIASRFPLEEATIDELGKATGMTVEELLPRLDKMADKGLVMDLPYADKTFYLLLPGLIGFFEFSFMKHRDDLSQDELARLMQEYMHENLQQGMAKEFFGNKTPLTRTLVNEEHIPVSSEVTSFENARQIIEQAGYGAVGICYCRHKQEHLGAACSKGAPMEDICISLGTGARFLVRRGFAKEQTTEQLLAVLDRARALGLTHMTDNIRHKPSFICNCCRCCCELMVGVQAGFSEGVGKTPFLAAVSDDKCNGCGLCVPACNVSSIALSEGGAERRAVIDKASCLGCGVCIPVCARKALTLEERQHRPVLPQKRKDMMVAILKEKGKLTPYVISAAKKRLARLRPGKR